MTKPESKTPRADASCPVVAWMREFSFDGEEIGSEIYDTRASCSHYVNEEGGIVVDLIRLSDHLAKVAAYRERINKLIAELVAESLVKVGLIEKVAELEAVIAAKTALIAELETAVKHRFECQLILERTTQALRNENIMKAAEVERLRGHIKRDSWITDTCTFNVLGEVCDGCRCGKAAALNERNKS